MTPDIEADIEGTMRQLDSGVGIPMERVIELGWDRKTIRGFVEFSEHYQLQLYGQTILRMSMKDSTSPFPFTCPKCGEATSGSHTDYEILCRDCSKKKNILDGLKDREEKSASERKAWSK